MKSLNFNDNLYKYEQSQLRKSAAAIIENIGFTTASNFVINTLTFLLKTYFEQLCHDTNALATHDQRDFVVLDDVAEIFIYHSINLNELHEYVHQIGTFSFCKPLPSFPIPTNIQLIEAIEASSEQENLVEKNSGDNAKKDENIKEIDTTKLDQNRTNMHLPQRAFPNFVDNLAGLGFTVQKIKPPLEEINIEQDLTRESVTLLTEFTFSIKQHKLIGPIFSTKSIYDEMRSKERKKKKQEKREQERMAKDRTKHKNEEKIYNNKSKESALSDEGAIELLPKVPKIKIRIGSASIPITNTKNQFESLPIISVPDVTIPSTSYFSQQQNISKNQSKEGRIKDPIMHGMILPVLNNKNASIHKSSEKSSLAPLTSFSPTIIKATQSEKLIENAKIEFDKILTPVPSSFDTTQQLHTPSSEVQSETATYNSKQQQTRKRSRKCAKPTRVDPSLIQTLDASPPPIPVRLSKAMESVVTKQKNPFNAKALTLNKSKLEKSMTTKPIINIPESVDEEEDIWICPICSVAYVENGPDMVLSNSFTIINLFFEVACDQCDRWYHWSCVGILLAPPENAKWYCTECKRIRKKQQLNAGKNDVGDGLDSRKSSTGAPPTKKQRQNR